MGMNPRNMELSKRADVLQEMYAKGKLIKFPWGKGKRSARPIEEMLGREEWFREKVTPV